jgi:hypothetical protein
VTASALEDPMATIRYEKQVTALLVIDPYNDFISEGGKIWSRLRGVAEANDCVPHMLQILNAALEIIIPNYASAVVTTKDIVGSISSL